tara:strand:+ start:176 stop:298 length:123 start_codon:yes stop_codon:yes gene_type:complete
MSKTGDGFTGFLFKLRSWALARKRSFLIFFPSKLKKLDVG